MKRSLFTGVLGLSVSMMGTAMASEVKVVPGELIVKFKEGMNKSVQGSLKSLGADIDRRILKDRNLYVVKVDQTKSLKGMQNLLATHPDIEYAEPNYIYELIRPVEMKDDLSAIIDSYEVDNSEYLYTPVDAKFNQLWGLQNTGDNDPTGARGVAGADIDAMKAWEITTGSRAVRIAVIDTGIDYNHPDLRNQMWTNEAELNGVEGVDDDGNGYVDDIHGYDFANKDGDPMDGNSHGTHCAGTIGAEHNDIGVAGVMSEVEFVGIKFLTDRGSGSTADAIAAVDYATKLNVDIMSNSWGGGGRSEALKEAIERAHAKGIIFTAAAGNSRTDNDAKPHYPSNYEVDNVISVAATTNSDSLASFSCYGRNTVHIAAPGHNILSTVHNGRYKSYSGTSMATPHVSGAIGLLIAKEGRIAPAELRDRLMKTSDPLASLRGKTINSGRLNAYNLLEEIEPERNEPRPDAWETVSVDAWESAHPYVINFNDSKTFSVPGAKFMRLVVKRIDTEDRYDFLAVKDANGMVAEKISGSKTDYKSFFIEGDTMIVDFSSDRSIVDWGFLIEEVEVQY